jgi:hypothetical protein
MFYKALYNGTFIKEVEERRKILNPSGQLNMFGEKVEKGNKVFGTPYENFRNKLRNSV